MTRREAALWIWEKQIGKPYIWGGDDPILGFDCSGLVLEGLIGIGMVPKGKDHTASSLALDVFGSKKALTKDKLQPGCLLFWQNNTKIFHVEIVWQVIEGLVLTIGASGGGSKTPTKEAAAAQNAYVKIRPAGGWSIGIDPFS